MQRNRMEWLQPKNASTMDHEIEEKEAQKCGNLNLLTRQLMFNQQKQQSLTATATLLRNAHISRFQIECIFLPFGMAWHGMV